jgi:Uma2 family endonuclease
MAVPLRPSERAIPMDHMPWSLDDWLGLPDSTSRVELVDGMLVVSPVEASGNARLMVRIVQQLGAAAPPSLEVMSPVNVGLGGPRALIPDFCVIDAPGLDAVVIPARHVVLVGEIASPSTRIYDRTTKRALYAEAGIPFLMLVDPGEVPTAVLFELRDGSYTEVGSSTDGRLEIARPIAATLEFGAPPALP